MNDEQWSRRDEAMTTKRPTAVPLRQVLGAAPPASTRALGFERIVAGIGWLIAFVVIIGGSLMIWQVLFGDSIGGDPWLGRPAQPGETLGSTPSTTRSPTTTRDRTVTAADIPVHPPTGTTILGDSATGSSPALDSPGGFVTRTGPADMTADTTADTTATSLTIDDDPLAGGNSGSGGSGSSGAVVDRKTLRSTTERSYDQRSLERPDHI